MGTEIKHHYVTNIEVKKVTTQTSSVSGESRVGTSTVARIVLSGNDIDAVRDKAAAHLALIEDGGEIDSAGKTMR